MREAGMSDTAREPYQAPAEPVVIGAMSDAAISYYGDGTDSGFYSSLPV
jgi:hypothetical protein